MSLPHHLINKLIDPGEYLVSLQRGLKQREMLLEEKHSFGGISLPMERENIDLIQTTLFMKYDQRSRSQVTFSDRSLSRREEVCIMFPPAPCTDPFHPDIHLYQSDMPLVAVTTHYTSSAAPSRAAPALAQT